MPAPDPLTVVEDHLVEHFGHRPARASVSFVGVERIDVLRFEPIPGERAYVSLGMSRHPMTGAAEAFVATDGPRAELMLHLRDPLDAHGDLWRRLALLAAAPAVEAVVYRPGMSVDLGEPLTSSSACTGVLVTASPIADVPSDVPVDVPSDVRAGAPEPGAVAVLQVVPATSAELAWCRVRGSDALRARWADAGTDLLDLDRRGVSLD